jgi:hypothetical protein
MKLSSITMMLVAFVAITLFSTSCREAQSSEDVNQDKIFTYYELYYNQNTDKTTAIARFTFGDALGTPLELASGATILANGQTLTFKAWNNYEVDFAGNVDSLTFEYTDLDGNTFVNTLNQVEIAYPADLDTIDRNAAFDLIWQGTALQADEKVLVTVNGVNEGDARTFEQDNVGATSIILDKNKLEQMGQGQGTIWMDRVYSPAIQQSPSVGGTTKSKYRPNNASVYLQ